MFRQPLNARRICMAGSILAVIGATFGVFGNTTYADGVAAGSTAVVDNAPYSTVGQTCDPNRNGYHFIMN